MNYRANVLTIGNTAVDTWVVAAGRDHASGSPLNVPIIPASTFVLGGPRAYARDDGTRSWESLEDIVGGLEGGRAVAFSSGMAAVAAVFQQLPIQAAVVIPEDCYAGVSSLVRWGVEHRAWRIRRLPVQATDEWVRACTEANLIWLESPSNPLLKLVDLRTICAAPRKRDSILAVDNTLATPLNQRPLEFGADVSVQSATKYIGGHSDLLMGIVTVRSPSLHQSLRHIRELHGATPGALECFLAIRGARTLALRFARAQETALTLASRLSQHPAIAMTRYPGLRSDPNHALARSQMRGFGAVISFDLRGSAPAAEGVCARLKLIQHATSLGAVESTIERRASIAGQEHIPASLLRLSVGIEDATDLWADLEQALAPLTESASGHLRDQERSF